LTHFFLRGGGGGALGGTYPSVVRLRLGPGPGLGLGGSFGMADLTCSVVAVVVALWAARIPLFEDSLTVPVVWAELVAWSCSPHFLGGGGACGCVDGTDCEGGGGGLRGGVYPFLTVSGWHGICGLSIITFLPVLLGSQARKRPMQPPQRRGSQRTGNCTNL
jgi:hypothetical protein